MPRRARLPALAAALVAERDRPFPPAARCRAAFLYQPRADRIPGRRLHFGAGPAWHGSDPAHGRGDAGDGCVGFMLSLGDYTPELWRFWFGEYPGALVVWGAVSVELRVGLPAIKPLKLLGRQLLLDLPVPSFRPEDGRPASGVIRSRGPRVGRHARRRRDCIAAYYVLERGRLRHGSGGASPGARPAAGVPDRGRSGGHDGHDEGWTPRRYAADGAQIMSVTTLPAMTVAKRREGRYRGS